jgi:hypothetical protein
MSYSVKYCIVRNISLEFFKRGRALIVARLVNNSHSWAAHEIFVSKLVVTVSGEDFSTSLLYHHLQILGRACILICIRAYLYLSNIIEYSYFVFAAQSFGLLRYINFLADVFDGALTTSEKQAENIPNFVIHFSR